MMRNLNEAMQKELAELKGATEKSVHRSSNSSEQVPLRQEWESLCAELRQSDAAQLLATDALKRKVLQDLQQNPVELETDEQNEILAWLDETLGDENGAAEPAVPVKVEPLGRSRSIVFGMFLTAGVIAAALVMMVLLRDRKPAGQGPAELAKGSSPMVVKSNGPKSTLPQGKDTKVASKASRQRESMANGPRKSSASKVASRGSRRGEWTDPLDLRISKASAKLHEKPVVLAGVMEHSIRQLDKRMTTMAKEMKRDKL